MLGHAAEHAVGRANGNADLCEVVSWEWEVNGMKMRGECANQAGAIRHLNRRSTRGEGVGVGNIVGSKIGSRVGVGAGVVFSVP